MGKIKPTKKTEKHSKIAKHEDFAQYNCHRTIIWSSIQTFIIALVNR